MKYILITLLIATSYSSLSGQDKNCRIDTEYFLLGTLDDYIGRQLYPEINNRVDWFYNWEKSLVLKLDSLFNNIYPDFEFKTDNETSVYEIYSSQLTKRINSYYIYKTTGSWTMSNDTVYIGYLKENISTNDLQKLSFLTGAFVRYGQKNETSYSIRIANSLSKVRICVELLKDLKCTDINYEIQHNTTPVVHTVYFYPSEKLMEYLNRFDYLRTQLDFAWKSKFKR